MYRTVRGSCQLGGAIRVTPPPYGRTMPRRSPSSVGAAAEMAVAAALQRAGWCVFIPLFAAHSRVDLVVCRADEVRRVQVKAGRLRNGCLEFHTCSNTRNEPQGYAGEIDLFAVHSAELDAVFLVPVDEVPARKGFLRIEAPKNRQAAGVRWADDYRLAAC